MSTCMCVNVCVCLHASISSVIFMYVTYGLGSVLLWRRYDTFYG